MSTYARGNDPHEPLDAVLRAASAPGHPEELAGEQAAVTAFRTAAAGARRRSILARVLTVKALIVGTVAASTGVVLATTGVLPVLRPEPVPPTLPAEPPAATSTVPDPAVPPPDGPDSRNGQGDTPVTGDSAGPGRPCDQCGDQQGDEGKPSKTRPPRDDQNDQGNNKHDRSTPPRSTTTSTPPDQGDNDDQQNGSTASRATQTPISSAPGAVNAVPPSGAEPPSQGG